jgi:DNA mismatch repair protein MutS2
VPENIIEGARVRLSKSAVEIETLLADLNEEKQKLKESQAEIEKNRQAAETLRRQLEAEKEKFKEEEANILSEIRTRLVRDGDDLQREIRDAMLELKKQQSKEKLEKAQKALSAMREQLKGKNWKPSAGQQQDTEEIAFKVGEKVWLSNMGVQGMVISPEDSNGQLEVQIGNSKVKIAPENLEKAKAAAGNIARYYASNTPRRTASLELDLRGRRADEVEYLLDGYLNEVSLANLPQVRIIHGVATGTVRQIVRSYWPVIRWYSHSVPAKKEGGDGVRLSSYSQVEATHCLRISESS